MNFYNIEGNHRIFFILVEFFFEKKLKRVTIPKITLRVLYFQIKNINKIKINLKNIKNSK